MEISGEKKNNNQEPAFDKVRGLFQEVSSGNEAENFVLWGIRGGHGACKDENDPGAPDECFSQPRQRNIRTENQRKNFTDERKFQDSRQYQVSPVDVPIRQWSD